MATGTIPTPFVMRLIGALAIDPVTYEEVESDRNATWQALLVVVMSSAAAGIGAFGWGNGSVRGVLFISALALLAWATWALVTFEIGTRLMPESGTRADVGQLMRTIGFSAAPGILRIFGIVPGATLPAFAITAVWMLVAMVVAVRQALDYESTARAVAVCALGWALSIGIAIALQLFFGPTVS
jgi:Yip1-like protein